MIDFKASIAKSQKTLGEIKDYVDKAEHDSLGEPQKHWVSHWRGKLTRYFAFANVLEDIKKREIAFKALRQFQMPTDSTPLWSVNYGTLPINSKYARHFYVAGYLAITWSIYDALYDAFTRLAGPATISLNKHPKKNKKVVEIFEPGNSDRAVIFCGVDELFRDRYWWTFKVSYTLRNAFLHEGGRLNGEAILSRDMPEDFFKISEEAKRFFEYIRQGVDFNSGKDIADPAGAMGDKLYQASLLRGVTQNERVTRGHVGEDFSNAPWYTEDIRDILEIYNSHLDDMFAHLITWATNSLKSQIGAMLGVDLQIEDASIVQQ